MMIIFLIISEDERIDIEKYYIEYGESMMRIALGILKNKFDAEVAIQESFRRIMEAMQSFQKIPEDKKKYYCLTTARNVSINMYKKKAMDVPVSEIYHLDDKSARVEDIVILQEDMAIVRELISELDENYRVPLLLRYYEFMTYKEIAALLGIKENNARKRVARALEQISERYKKVGGVIVGK